MTGWQTDDLLYLRFCTDTPRWCLAADSDTLFLSAGHNEKEVAIRLNTAQLTQIDLTMGRCVKTMVNVTILGAHLRLYLVGRRVNDYMWKGIASSDVSFLRTAPNLLEPASPSNVVDLAQKQK